MKWAVIISTVKANNCSRLLRRNKSGRLASEPLLILGSLGRVLTNTAAVRAAAIPISRKLSRQPYACPAIRPNGMPNTIASTVPILSRLKA